MAKKKILLVHPLGYSKEAAKADIARKANLMPPLGLASIAAWLEAHGIGADIVDCFADPDSDRTILDYVRESRPDFVGFSCTTSSFIDGHRLALLVKEANPAVKTIFGGAHVSALREKVLADFPGVDFAVVGEGEECVREIIQAEGLGLEHIEGLVYRGPDGAPVFTGFRKELLDLDSLPFPAYEKLAGFPEKYKLPIFNYPKTPNTSCISSRGCPYACSYCDRSVFRRSFRYNSAAYLYRHMTYLKERFGISHINFYDDQFTFNRKRVEEFCRLIIDNSLGMTFNCAVRAEHIDFDLLKLMKQAGCWMISLGIETGDEDLLAQHRQNADLAMLADKIRMIHKAGIRVKGLLMMGLPGESEESIKKSMNYVFSLPVDDFNLSKFTPFPGSPLYEKVDDLGEFIEDWERMDCMEFLFIPKGMTKERMDELFINFYKSHYTRIKVLAGYVAMLWKSPDSWRRFLGDFFSFWRFAHGNSRIVSGD